MNLNTSNGGLILKLHSGQILLTDVATYTGTYMVHSDHSLEKLSEGLFWFMNADNQDIYYSDQKNSNWLYKYNLFERRAELILDQPCYSLTLKEDWLYFINEIDQNLYRVSKDGSNLTKIVDEQILGFDMTNNPIWYATVHGKVKAFDLLNLKQGEVLDISAVGLIGFDNRFLIYADRYQGYRLTFYDISNEEFLINEDVEATNFNTDGRFIYCSNKKEESSLFRISIEDNNPVRIFGGHADFIHLVDGEIFFLEAGRKRAWYRMPITGGQAKNVMG